MSVRTTELMHEARRYVNLHLGNAWSIQWGRAKRQAGVCNYKTRTITISLPIAELNPNEEFWDTVKHEVAHAQAGYAAGHGYEWKVRMLALGGRPNRCTEAKTPPRKWIGTCPNGHQTHRYRLTEKAMTRISCGKCCSYYNPTFRYSWSINDQALVLS